MTAIKAFWDFDTHENNDSGVLVYWSTVSNIKVGIEAKSIWKQNPRRLFGQKTDENNDWKKLYNEKIHSLYRSPGLLNLKDQNG